MYSHLTLFCSNFSSIVSFSTVSNKFKRTGKTYLVKEKFSLVSRTLFLGNFLNFYLPPPSSWWSGSHTRVHQHIIYNFLNTHSETQNIRAFSNIYSQLLTLIFLHNLAASWEGSSPQQDFPSTVLRLEGWQADQKNLEVFCPAVLQSFLWKVYLLLMHPNLTFSEGVQYV